MINAGDPDMVMVVFDREMQRDLIRDRRDRGVDRFDEVWDGVYVMSPLADNEHQSLALDLAIAFKAALSTVRGAKVFQGCNVGGRSEKWKKNYRCPDVAAFLAGNPAKDMGTFWFGGPDFAVEILSPQDRSRKKLDFYAKVGVRELLLVDRKPWSIELYRLIEGELKLVGKVDPILGQALISEVLPLSFGLLPAEPRPTIEVIHTDGRTWTA